MNLVRIGIQLGLFVATLSIGVAGYLAIGRPPEPEQVAGEAVLGRSVQAMRVARRDFSAPLVAHGTARVPRIHAIRPQVGRRVVRVSDRFVEGKRVRRDDVLFALDDQDFQVAIRESEARIRETEATLLQIDARIQPLESRIRRLEQEAEDVKKTEAILEEAVRLARSEVDRLTRLAESGAASVQSVEAARQVLNKEEQALTTPRSRLNQIPIEIQATRAEIQAIEAERAVMNARKSVAEAQLERARLDLSRIEVKSPVDGVVVLRSPETGLTVKALALDDVLIPGQDVGWILETDGGIEIPVSVDLADLVWLRGGPEGRIALDALAGLAELDVGEVRVQWYRNLAYAWTGRIDRVRGELDEATRTATFIVRVDDPGRELVPGERFPLTRGMFCRVEIPGRIHQDAIVIPREALREGRTVHVVENGRLAIREIGVLRLAEDQVVVESGLEAGEVLILTNLPSAIQGMPVQPSIRE